jgi:hypothetical protein
VNHTRRNVSFPSSWLVAADTARSRGQSRPLQNRLQPYRQPGIALSAGPGLPKCALNVPVWRAGSVPACDRETQALPGPDIWNEVQKRFQERYRMPASMNVSLSMPIAIIGESVAARVMNHSAPNRPRCLLDAEAAPTRPTDGDFLGTDSPIPSL